MYKNHLLSEGLHLTVFVHGIVTQIVELPINGSYVFEVYVPWKSDIPIICISMHLFTGQICHFLKIQHTFCDFL